MELFWHLLGNYTGRRFDDRLRSYRADLGRFARRIGMGLFLLIISLVGWLTGFIFLILSLFFSLDKTLLHLVDPALICAAVCAVLAILLTILGRSVLRKT